MNFVKRRKKNRNLKRLTFSPINSNQTMGIMKKWKDAIIATGWSILETKGLIPFNTFSRRNTCSSLDKVQNRQSCDALKLLTNPNNSLPPALSNVKQAMVPLFIWYWHLKPIVSNFLMSDTIESMTLSRSVNSWCNSVDEISATFVVN